MNNQDFDFLRKRMEESSHFKDMEYSKGGKRRVLSKVYYREVVSDIIIFLLSIFLINLFFANSELLGFAYINGLFELVAIIFSIWLSLRIARWMTRIRFQMPIQLVTGLLITLFFVHQMFAPYFYTEQYLKKIGTEKIEIYLELSEEKVAQKEGKRLAKSALSDLFAFSTIEQNRYQQGELINLKVIDFKREVNIYQLKVQVKQQYGTKVETSNFLFTLSQEYGKFKLDGYTIVN